MHYLLVTASFSTSSISCEGVFCSVDIFAFLPLTVWTLNNFKITE